ncbi:uncharacterized protein BO97DRAFT_230646 [Aspergillus homomorphus CBS 101889]|uniref:Uncharacterized protein n=1 Tax=Aspergillus homomorphus (strain CBS 101889) TaxID=1450537 RepID=A0A395HK67_ASPHC|nr:hypothetical protein BO97DRAFT_230646 [Aspergillus homomorphus CBS 101889]RAL07909.1 hypothetical protein BO97DRAFT_230646 [Aspergillus homomorphus CBS 101889]
MQPSMNACMNALGMISSSIEEETWETEFEGHSITVTGEKEPLQRLRSHRTSPAADPERSELLIPVLTFCIPPNVDEPWEFAVRFLQHEVNTQRQNHDYPADTTFAGVACCEQLGRYRIFYEASPADPGPLLGYTSPRGQVELPMTLDPMDHSIIQHLGAFVLFMLLQKNGRQARAEATTD